MNITSKQVYAALASDFKRIALSIGSGAEKTAVIFAKEALAYQKNDNIKTLPQSLQPFLADAFLQLKNPTTLESAESCLLASVILKNYLFN